MNTLLNAKKTQSLTLRKTSRCLKKPLTLLRTKKKIAESDCVYIYVYMSDKQKKKATCRNSQSADVKTTLTFKYFFKICQNMRNITIALLHYWDFSVLLE